MSPNSPEMEGRWASASLSPGQKKKKKNRASAASGPRSHHWEVTSLAGRSATHSGATQARGCGQQRTKGPFPGACLPKGGCWACPAHSHQFLGGGRGWSSLLLRAKPAPMGNLYMTPQLAEPPFWPWVRLELKRFLLPPAGEPPPPCSVLGREPGRRAAS